MTTTTTSDLIPSSAHTGDRTPSEPVPSAHPHPVPADEVPAGSARDLHDRLGRSLTSLGSELDRVLARDAAGHRVSDDLAMLRSVVRGVMAELRGASDDGRAHAGGPTDPTDRLITKREEEVLQLIADGCSTPEVAGRMFISQKTVKNHLASIYAKLDTPDRTQAVLRAVRMGIVSLG